MWSSFEEVQMLVEYKTTTGRIIYKAGEVVKADDPVVPEGDGWKLLGALVDRSPDWSTIVWTWEREVEQERKA